MMINIIYTNADTEPMTFVRELWTYGYTYILYGGDNFVEYFVKNAIKYFITKKYI